MGKMFLGKAARILFTLAFLIGCTTQSTTQIQKPFDPVEYRVLSIEACVNRTDYKGTHDLAAEATRALTKKLEESELFDIKPDANLVLTCDIMRFGEGSSLKRWVMPGRGITQAEVVVMVWKKEGEQVLATFRSEASIKSGGFYTVGADQYIFAVAFDDLLKEMKAWASGNEAEESDGQ